MRQVHVAGDTMFVDYSGKRPKVFDGETGELTKVLQIGTGGCARANACVDARDPSTRTCGDGPACDPLEVCAWDTSDGLAYCRCISPATP